jgi:hypothetical protein
MKFILKISLYSTATFFQLTAQVINIEGKRFLNDTNGFVGKTELNYNVTQNVQKFSVLGVNIHAQYKHQKHRFLAISDLAFIKSGNQDYTNSGYQHLRYNYKIAKLITVEAFIQAQYNRVLKLDRRYLAGVGPRFRLIKSPHFKLYAAGIYMYEYQSQNMDSIHQFNHRGSVYLSLNFDYQKVDFVNTFFYQPNLSKFNNFRIANDASLEIELSKKFDFKTGLNLLYDTRQPFGVPALTYILKNGIIIRL